MNAFKKLRIPTFVRTEHATEWGSHLNAEQHTVLVKAQRALSYTAADALALSERAMAVNPIEKDPLDGPVSIEVLARVAAQMGEPDRAIGALQKLLSMPSYSPLASNVRSASE